QDLLHLPDHIPPHLTLSLGVVDGRNIWINDLSGSLQTIRKVTAHLEEERIMIASSCSLLHVPFDLDMETDEQVLPAEIKKWMAFARQKLDEVVTLGQLSVPATKDKAAGALAQSDELIRSRKASPLIRRP